MTDCYKKCRNLVKLLSDSEFNVINLISYGFPLPKLIERITEQLIDKPKLKRLEKEANSQKTCISVIDREDEYKFNKSFPYRMFVILIKSNVCSINQI